MNRDNSIPSLTLNSEVSSEAEDESLDLYMEDTSPSFWCNAICTATLQEILGIEPACNNNDNSADHKNKSTRQSFGTNVSMVTTVRMVKSSQSFEAIRSTPNNYNLRDLDYGYESDTPYGAQSHRYKPNNRAHINPIEKDVNAYIEGFDINKIEMFDDEEVMHLIQNFIRDEFQLTWHGPTKSNNVYMWVELGTLTTNHIVQPRFVWKKAPTNVTTYSHINNNIELPKYYKVDILDTCRVEMLGGPDNQYNQKYPFANPYKCFIIRTVDGAEFMFECSTRHYMEYIATHFKLLISKLISQVYTDPSNAYDEFYSHKNWKKPFNMVKRTTSTATSQSNNKSRRETNKDDTQVKRKIKALV